MDVQQKRLRRGTEKNDLTYKVRSYANGWVFCREGIELPQCVTDASLAAVKCLALDFGAVDVGYNRKEDRAAVFEVNTAPGIEGTTLEVYANALRTYAA